MKHWWQWLGRQVNSCSDLGRPRWQSNQTNGVGKFKRMDRIDRIGEIWKPWLVKRWPIKATSDVTWSTTGSSNQLAISYFGHTAANQGVACHQTTWQILFEDHAHQSNERFERRHFESMMEKKSWPHHRSIEGNVDYFQYPFRPKSFEFKFQLRH